MAKNSSTEKESNFSFVLIIELCKNKYYECFYELFCDGTVISVLKATVINAFFVCNFLSTLCTLFHVLYLFLVRTLYLNTY